MNDKMRKLSSVRSMGSPSKGAMIHEFSLSWASRQYAVNVMRMEALAAIPPMPGSANSDLNEECDALSDQQERLLIQAAQCEAQSLADIVLKLELWRKESALVAADLTSADCLVLSALADLERLTGGR